VDLLYNQTVALHDLLPRQEIERVQNILTDTDDVRQHVLSVERFLTSQIRAQNSISPQVESAESADFLQVAGAIHSLG
jgi:hypothetical protein